MVLLDKKIKCFVKGILSYWDNCRREFPWRHTKDPYKILITETLLRKTTAKQVDALYHDFFNRYPDIDALANADVDELKKILTPLGMENRRSEGLKKLAKSIMEDYGGEIPKDHSHLMSLYGVGRYTAGGVMCLAYKIDSAMVDTNVVRVMERYFGFKSSRKRPRDDPGLWSFVKNLIPKGKCKEFNLGLIDFANEFCSSRKPKCDICSINKQCKFVEEYQNE